MQCSRCQCKNLADAAFCQHCREKLELICSSCRTANTADRNSAASAVRGAAGFRGVQLRQSSAVARGEPGDGVAGTDETVTSGRRSRPQTPAPADARHAPGAIVFTREQALPLDRWCDIGPLVARDPLRSSIRRSVEEGQQGPRGSNFSCP